MVYLLTGLLIGWSINWLVY